MRLSNNATEHLNEAHILSALAEIDRQGVPDSARSTAYDLAYEGTLYPPNLVVSVAAKAATGESLDLGTFSEEDNLRVVSLLRRLGFAVETKSSEASDIAKLLDKFLAQAQGNEGLTVKEYLKTYRDLTGCGNTSPRSHPKGQFKRC